MLICARGFCAELILKKSRERGIFMKGKFFNKKATCLFLCLALLISILSGTVPAMAEDKPELAATSTTTTVPSKGEISGSTQMKSDSATPYVRITTPSVNERVIAPGRDFYVLGEMEGVGDASHISVELIDSNGKTVRELSL